MMISEVREKNLRIRKRGGRTVKKGRSNLLILSAALAANCKSDRHSVAHLVPWFIVWDITSNVNYKHAR
jgi:hypothetical protein